MVKRLSGWDAVLLYSETPNVHMHTIKVAVIELEPGRREFGVDGYCRCSFMSIKFGTPLVQASAL